jgi:hypothetical protein
MNGHERLGTADARVSLKARDEMFRAVRRSPTVRRTFGFSRHLEKQNGQDDFRVGRTDRRHRVDKPSYGCSQ